MRALILTLMLASPVSAKPLLLDRPDLHAHFWLSYGLAMTLTEVLEGPRPEWGPQLGTGWALLIATGAVGLLGVGKELADSTFSGDDLVADSLGLGMNALLQVTIEF